MAAPRDLRGPMIAVAITGALFSLAMTLLVGLRAGGSTFVGGAVVVLNLWALGRAIGGTIGAPPTRSQLQKLLSFMGGIARMFALYAGVWWLLTRGWADPIPFVVGLMALPFGLVAGQVIGSMRSSGRAKEAHADSRRPDDP